MKIIWSPAVTLDGYIARADGDSDWVSDEDGELFHDLIRQTGCVIVGRKTYEQYKGQVFPVGGATTFVWTRHPETGGSAKGVEFVSGTPAQVAERLHEKGFDAAVLAGGGTTNNAFVSSGLITEVIATVYPMTFGDGIRMLSKECSLDLELIATRVLNGGIVRQQYKVK